MPTQSRPLVQHGAPAARSGRQPATLAEHTALRSSGRLPLHHPPVAHRALRFLRRMGRAPGVLGALRFSRARRIRLLSLGLHLGRMPHCAASSDGARGGPRWRQRPTLGSTPRATGTSGWQRGCLRLSLARVPRVRPRGSTGLRLGTPAPRHERRPGTSCRSASGRASRPSPPGGDCLTSPRSSGPAMRSCDEDRNSNYTQARPGPLSGRRREPSLGSTPAPGSPPPAPLLGWEAHRASWAAPRS